MIIKVVVVKEIDGIFQHYLIFNNHFFIIEDGMQVMRIRLTQKSH